VGPNGEEKKLASSHLPGIEPRSSNYGNPTTNWIYGAEIYLKSQ